jgi:hypothetical protein
MEFAVSLRHPLMLALVLVFASSPLASCGPNDFTSPPAYPPGSVQRSRAALVNGQLDPGHPAVGRFTQTVGACTATLIAPDRVLTAAHCVKGSKQTFEVGGGVYDVAEAINHPGWKGSAPNFDIAVLKLATPVTNVTPMPLASEPPHPGEPIIIVGFGLTGVGTGDSGVKRMANTNVKLVKKQVFWIGDGSGSGPTVCYGDSGGPTLVFRDGVEQLLGVHSTTQGGEFECKGMGHDMRVDVFKEWVETLQVTPAGYGAPCAADAHCTTGLCAPNPIYACVKRCDQGCGADQCVKLSYPGFTQDPICYPGTGGSRGFGQPCDAFGECNGGFCIAVDGFGGVCTRYCDKDPCPNSFECRKYTFGKICEPDASWKPPEGRADLGATCAENRDCKSYLCLPVGTVRSCSQSCDKADPASCPTGFDCATLGGRDYCLKSAAPPEKAALGESCSDDESCKTGLLCREHAVGDKRCSSTCSALQPCVVANMSCQTVGSERLCLPAEDAGGGGGGCRVAGPKSGSKSGSSAPLRLLALLALLALCWRRR